MGQLRNDSLKRKFAAAAKAGIVIPAFNIPYIPMVEPVIQALKKYDTFGLVEVSRIEFQKFEAKNPQTVADEFSRYSDPSITALHLDHVPVVDEDGLRADWEALIAAGIEAGFDSVMIDGSRLPFEENIQAVSRVVQMAHPEGVLVEAELGAVLGHEAGPMPPYEELFASKKGFTDPHQAREFVQRTGIDWLSVSVGSVHGAISGAAFNKEKVPARLDIEHLKKLHDVTGVPLVLHGGSGVQQSYVDEAIENGLVKINIGTDIRIPYARALDAGGSVADAQAAVLDKTSEIICNKFRIEGTASRLIQITDGGQS